MDDKYRCTVYPRPNAESQFQVFIGRSYTSPPEKRHKDERATMAGTKYSTWGGINRQSLAKVVAGKERNDIELMIVAIMDMPTTHPGIARLPRKKLSEEVCRRAQ